MTRDNSDPSAFLLELQSEEQKKKNDTVEDIKADYVESARDDEFASHMQKLINNASSRRNPDMPRAANNRRPGMALLLTAPSGAGKSRTTQNYFKDNRAFPNYGIANQWCPLITVNAPAPCTLLQLAMCILIALGYESAREMRENAAWLRVRIQLQEQRILFLFIDDFQHVLHQINEFEIQKVRDTLKNLMTSLEWPIQIILAGMPELIPFAKADPQLRRRLKFMKLEPVSPADDFEFIESAITAYTAKAGLKLGVDKSKHLVGRLCHAATYMMGITLEILTEAIETAVERGSKTLTLDDFANAYAARNLQPNDQNPFVSHAWDTIDTTLLRPKNEDPTAADIGQAEETKTRRRRRSKK
jgi:hypothetical protein